MCNFEDFKLFQSQNLLLKNRILCQNFITYVAICMKFGMLLTYLAWNNASEIKYNPTFTIYGCHTNLCSKTKFFGINSSIL